jgi:hypothetical protein
MSYANVFSKGMDGLMALPLQRVVSHSFPDVPGSNGAPHDRQGSLFLAVWGCGRVGKEEGGFPKARTGF